MSNKLFLLMAFNADIIEKNIENACIKELPRVWPILTKFSISVIGEYGSSFV